jgi:hypothetical protein
MFKSKDIFHDIFGSFLLNAVPTKRGWGEEGPEKVGTNYHGPDVRKGPGDGKFFICFVLFGSTVIY